MRGSLYLWERAGVRVAHAWLPLPLGEGGGEGGGSADNVQADSRDIASSGTDSVRMRCLSCSRYAAAPSGVHADQIASSVSRIHPVGMRAFAAAAACQGAKSRSM